MAEENQEPTARMKLVKKYDGFDAISLRVVLSSVETENEQLKMRLDEATTLNQVLMGKLYALETGATWRGIPRPPGQQPPRPPVPQQAQRPPQQQPQQPLPRA